MINRLFHRLPSWIFLYSTAAITIFLSFVYSIYFLVTDNDPPTFPLKSESTPIDCCFIKAKSMNIAGSRVTFNLSIDKFVQFPPEAAIGLVKIIARNGEIVNEYTSEKFWDETGDLNDISFNILHPIQGDVSFSLKCSRIPLMEKNATIKEVDVYPIGWSRFMKREFTLLDVYDACWYNRNMTFSISTGAQFSSIISSQNSTIDVSSVAMSAESFANHIKIPYLGQEKGYVGKAIVLFLDANPNLGWQIILDVILPIWVNTYYTRDKHPQSLVLTRDQDGFRNLLDRIFKGQVLNKNHSMCFNNGIVLSNTYGYPYYESQDKHKNKFGASSYKHIEFITRLKREIISSIKNNMTSKIQNPQAIALESSCTTILPFLRILYPQTEINVINDSDDIFITADIIARSRVFIGSKIQTLAYSIFLQDGSYIIETVPFGQECVRAGEKWAYITNANYIPIGIQEGPEYCKSKTLEDYFNSIDGAKYPEITSEMLKETLDPIILPENSP